jgi:hypothetical protein
MRRRRIKEGHDLLVLRLLSSDTALRHLLLLPDGTPHLLHTTPVSTHASSLDLTSLVPLLLMLMRFFPSVRVW